MWRLLTLFNYPRKFHFYYKKFCSNSVFKHRTRFFRIYPLCIANSKIYVTWEEEEEEVDYTVLLNNYLFPIITFF